MNISLTAAFIFSVTFIACQNKTDLEHKKFDNPLNDSVSKQRAPSNKELEYFFESDSVRQTLKVKWIGKDSIQYHLISSAKELDCRQTISGIAITLSTKVNVEMDEDEEGVGYPFIEYWDTSNNKFAIRISYSDRNMAKIKFPEYTNIEFCGRLFQDNIMKIKKK